MLGMEKRAPVLLLFLQAAFGSCDVNVWGDKPFPSKLLLLTGGGFAAEMSYLLLSTSMTLSPSPAAILLPMLQQLFLRTFIFGNCH